MSESSKSSLTGNISPSPRGIVGSNDVDSNDVTSSDLAPPIVSSKPVAIPPPPRRSSPPAAPPAPPAPPARRVSDVSVSSTPPPVPHAPPRPTSEPKRRRRWFGRRAQNGSTVTAGEYQAQQSEQRRQVPAWLVSFIVHLLLVLILAAIPLAQLARGPLTIMMGFSSTHGIAAFELSSIDSSIDAKPIDAERDVPDPIQDPGELLQLDLPDLVDVKPPTTPGSDPLVALANIPFGITSGLTGRSGELKSALLSKFGGNSETEEAVDLGLKWLAQQQKSNGSWSLVGPYSDGGVSENTTAATALALNAFLGAGSTHKEGKYRDNVKLGLSYLVRKQNADGYFPDQREPSRQQMYAQAIASITVAEAYGMSGDSDLAMAAQRAMKFAAWSQSDLRGWRYQPRDDADLSVTGWFVMALITGKMAGLTIDEEKLQQVTEFLNSVSYEEQTRYAYDGFEPPSLSMTAEGLLCRIYLGWPRTHPALLRAVEDDLLTSPPSMNDAAYSVYYWYYATQVLHHVGGSQWERWNRSMKQVLPALQEREGRELGSWSPSNDAFGASGGRLYTTCLNLYCLEVYYRHLSIYDIP